MRSKKEEMRMVKGGNVPGRKVVYKNQQPSSRQVPAFSQDFSSKHLGTMPQNFERPQKEAIIRTNASKNTRPQNDYFMTSKGQRGQAAKHVSQDSRGEKTFPIRARHVETQYGVIQPNPDTAKKHSYEITGTDTRPRATRIGNQINHFKSYKRLPKWSVSKSAPDSSDSD